MWVVDDHPGPGVDYTTLQSAIDAAVDGDVVLLRDGQYGPSLIEGKAITLVSDTGAHAVVKKLTIADLTGAQTVALRGLRGPPLPPGGSPGTNWLLATDCAGAIWCEELDASGTASPFTANIAVAEFDTVAAAICIRCSFTSKVSGWGDSGGNPAMRARSSSLYVFDSTLSGCKGGEWFPTFYGGSAGLEVEPASALFVAGSTLRGGDAGSCLSSCAPGAPGGPGLRVDAAAATSLDSVFTGGGGGWAAGLCTPSFQCFSGPPGVPLVLSNGGTLAAIAEDARTFRIDSPVRAGQPASVVAHGAPADFVVGLFAAAPSPTLQLPFGALALPLALGAATQIVVLGSTDTNGTLTQTVSFEPFPLGLESLVVFTQAAFVRVEGSVTLGSGSMLVVLNQVF